MTWFQFRKKNNLSTKLGENSFLMMVEEARREMHFTGMIFRQAETPLAVDYAVHAMDAARGRYLNLLHEARKQELSADKAECAYLALSVRSRDPYGRV